MFTTCLATAAMLTALSVLFVSVTLQQVARGSDLVNQELYLLGIKLFDFSLPPWLDALLYRPLQFCLSTPYVIACFAWLRLLLLIFLLPAAFVLFLYMTALIVQLYIIRHWICSQLRRFSSHHVANDDQTATSLYLSSPEFLRRIVAVIWNAHGRVFHGYEVQGMEKLPLNEPAFIVYYHGTLPLDAYYFVARHIIERDRNPIPIIDRFVFHTPGLQRMIHLSGAIEGSVDECVHRLRGEPQEPSDCATTDKPKVGDVLLLSPGGVREALFSDEYYSILWGKRRGFARVALAAQQPIYPMFTENIRESIRVVQYGKTWWRWLYERTRLPFGIFYGYFPVKLRTYIGDPIYPLPSETDEELADRVRLVMEDLIRQHQWTPGNIIYSLLQRIPVFDAWLIRKKRLAYTRCL